MDRIRYVFNIALVALLFGVVAISRDGRILGHSIDGKSQRGEVVAEPPVEAKDVEEVLFDGTRVVHSAPLARDVVGFASTTPVTIYIKDGVIADVIAEPNEETPSFFRRLEREGLLDSWSHKSLAEALETRVDVVSGATYSSVAVIENVNRAVAYAASVEPSQRRFNIFDAKSIVGLVVILLGVALTFWRPRQRWIEIAYMVLNVGVLGFWCGSFLSLAQFTSWMSNGVSLSLTLALLLVIVLVPIFGRRGSYCQLHCPMGSAQELLSRLPIPQIKLSAEYNRRLNNLRYYIFALLMLLMWCGVGFEIMNYEVFSVFFPASASGVVLGLAALFLILSLFIKRPYCRFVCPTGAVITMAQKSKLG